MGPEPTAGKTFMLRGAAHDALVHHPEVLSFSYLLAVIKGDAIFILPEHFLAKTQTRIIQPLRSLTLKLPHLDNFFKNA